MNKSIALLAFGLAGIALAQAAYPSFDDVDTNHDGMISRDEASKIEGLDFAKCDANQDGNLSREEYAACTQPQGGGNSGDNNSNSGDNDSN